MRRSDQELLLLVLQLLLYAGAERRHAWPQLRFFTVGDPSDETLYTEVRVDVWCAACGRPPHPTPMPLS